MAFIQWDSSFSVNISEIDKQHQNVVNIINDLNDSMKSRLGRQATAAIIDRLFAYAGEHFRTEETYFDRFKYPQRETHKTEHAYFVARMTDFKNDFENGQVALSVEILSFMKEWLKGHLLDVDKQYGPYLNGKGLF